MGKKAKSSRKGKKAWRANISTEDIEEYFEKSTKDALSGGSLADAPSDSLFFVDKSRDLSVKRKIEKHRQKVLHCDSLLQRNPFIQPIPSSKQKKTKLKSKETQRSRDAIQNNEKDNGVTESGMEDIWSSENIAKRKKKSKPSIIPAVEVEPAGCSFNPSSESHQDSLALAVADEMQKVYKEKLGPEPVPLTVPGEAIDEENIYFLDADADDGSEDDNPNEDLNEDFERRPIKPKRVTRVELNRRARHKERLRAEEEAKKVERLSTEIDSLADIMQEIAKDDEEKQRRHLRRTVTKQERLKCCPPRLGKYKFVPAPHQVLLSEEITGSLRKLKGCCTLARDRYKSLEKRGLVAPTKKSSRK